MTRSIFCASPGIVNFSQLYPTPPNSDVHGNIPLPSGGEIRVGTFHWEQSFGYVRSGGYMDDLQIAAQQQVPEPTSLALAFLCGAAVLGARRR